MRAILNVKRLRLLSVGFTNFNFKKYQIEYGFDKINSKISWHALCESCSSLEKALQYIP